MADYQQTSFSHTWKDGPKMDRGVQKWCEGGCVSPMISLQPSTPVPHKPSPCQLWGRGKQGEQCRDGTQGTKATGGSSLEDREVVRAALLFMDIPHYLVQLLMDMQHVDPTSSFTPTQQFYQRACDLLDHPEAQADLLRQREAGHTSPSPGPLSSASAHRGPALSPCPLKAAEQQHKSPAAMPDTAPCSASADSISSGTGCAPAAAVTSEPLPLQTVQASQACAAGSASLFQRSATEASSQEAGKPSMSEVSKTSLQQPDKTISCNEEASSSDSSKLSSKELLREKVRHLAMENWRLTQRKTCRACRKVDLSSSGVTFLPCGHFITCQPCSDQFDDCPACGKVIMGTVRTFLS